MPHRLLPYEQENALYDVKQLHAGCHETQQTMFVHEVQPPASCCINSAACLPPDTSLTVLTAMLHKLKPWNAAMQQHGMWPAMRIIGSVQAAGWAHKRDVAAGTPAIHTFVSAQSPYGDDNAIQYIGSPFA